MTAATPVAVSGAVVAPQGLNVTPAAVAQEAPGASAAAPAGAQSPGSSEATAIHAPGQQGQEQSYAGRVYVDRDDKLQTVDDGAKSGDTLVPNVKIYLQWMNSEGFVSPIYYTTSDSEGKFVFDLSEPVKDALGNEHNFQLAGDANFKVRTWIENPDPEKYTVV
ncbi:hypothetical protein, partial [Corynebacterium frankenforstense]